MLDSAERLARKGDVGAAVAMVIDTLDNLSHPQRIGVINLRVREVARVGPASARESAAVRQLMELVAHTEQDEP